MRNEIDGIHSHIKSISNLKNQLAYSLVLIVFIFLVCLIIPSPSYSFDKFSNLKDNSQSSVAVDCLIKISGPATISVPSLNGWPSVLQVPKDFIAFGNNGWSVPGGNYTLPIYSQSYLNQTIVITSKNGISSDCISGSIQSKAYPGGVNVVSIETITKTMSSQRGFRVLLNGQYKSTLTIFLHDFLTSIILLLFILFIIFSFAEFGRWSVDMDEKTSYIFGFLLAGAIFGSLNYWVTGVKCEVILLFLITLKFVYNRKSGFQIISVAKILNKYVVSGIFIIIFVAAGLDFSTTGLEQTDSELYRIILTQIHNTKLYNVPGLQIGNGMRSLDWSDRSVFSFIPTSTPGSALLTWAILLAIMALCGIFCLTATFKHITKLRLLACSTVLLSALIGLWTEAYLTKYCFLACAAIVAVFGLIATHNAKNAQVKLPILAIYALSSAWCCSIQPFSAFLVFSLPAIFLFQKRWKPLFFLTSIFLISFSLTSLWVRKLSIAISYSTASDGLNGIGKNIIWPNYHNLSLLPQLLGFTAWHSSGSTRPVTATVLSTLPHFERSLISSINTVAVIVSILILCLYFIWLSKSFRTKNIFMKSLYFFLLLNFAILGISFEKNFYIFISTLVCTVPVAMVIAIACLELSRPSERNGKTVTVLLIIFTITAMANETSLYLRNPAGRVSSASYFTYAFQASRLNHILGDEDFQIIQGDHSSLYESEVLSSEVVAQKYHNRCKNCSLNISSVLSLEPLKQNINKLIVISGNCPIDYVFEGDIGPFAICTRKS